jgi:hypothetical protein
VQVVADLVETALPVQQPQHVVMLGIEAVVLERHRVLDDEILAPLALHPLHHQVGPADQWDRPAG